MTTTCTPLEAFRAEEAARADQQDLVNRAAAVMNPTFVRRMIERLANDEHAPFPHYQGSWAGADWQLAVVTQDVRGKGGLRFAAGDTVIARSERSAVAMYPGVTAYSVRGSIDCSIYSGDLEFLG